MEVIVFDGLTKLYERAARTFVRLAEQSIQKNGRFVIALSGGSSPVGLFDLLTSRKYLQQVDWNKVYVFWVDERWVPFDDNRSNTRMIFEKLLNKVAIDRNHVFPMYREAIRPEEWADIYEQQIKDVVGFDGTFDFILLGMGDDGHTASLFPFEKVLEEQKKWVLAYYLKAQDMFRITLTAPLINKATDILAIVFGPSKMHALNKVISREYWPKQYPLQLVSQKKGFTIFTTEGTVY